MTSLMTSFLCIELTLELIQELASCARGIKFSLACNLLERFEDILQAFPF